MSDSPGNPGARTTVLARRRLQGRRRDFVGAAIVAIWVLVAVVVALSTASGVVWF